MNEERQKPESRLEKTGKEIKKIFIYGILLFCLIMGSITLVGLFLNHVKL